MTLSNNDKRLVDAIEPSEGELSSQSLVSNEMSTDQRCYALIRYIYDPNNDFKNCEIYHELHDASSWFGLAELIKEKIRPMASHMYSLWNLLPQLSVNEVNEYRVQFNNGLEEVLKVGRDMTAEQFLKIGLLGEDLCLELNIVAYGDSASFPASVVSLLDSNKGDELNDYLTRSDYPDGFLHCIPDSGTEFSDIECVRSHLKKCKLHREQFVNFKESLSSGIDAGNFADFIREIVAEEDKGERIRWSFL